MIHIIKIGRVIQKDKNLQTHANPAQLAKNPGNHKYPQNHKNPSNHLGI